MKIVDFAEEHLAQAETLALAGYEEERVAVPALPMKKAVPDLASFVGNGMGVAAVEGERLLGFLCAYPPFDQAFGSTDVRGVFSPMGGNGALKENRLRIYEAMYQKAAAKWVGAGVVSHAVCLYAHDEELQRLFYRYGFGLRCMDGVRLMEEIPCKPCGGYEFAELPLEECGSVYPLDLALVAHFLESPFFMNRKPSTEEEFVHSCKTEGARIFTAHVQGALCAYLLVTATGETFAAGGAGYRHINGAYCLPEHRGKGIYQNLINTAIRALKAEGFTHFGVDFESINPTAYGFWCKYFAAYTHGVVRRIDERILQVK